MQEKSSSCKCMAKPILSALSQCCILWCSQRVNPRAATIPKSMGKKYNFFPGSPTRLLLFPERHWGGGQAQWELYLWPHGIFIPKTNNNNPAPTHSSSIQGNPSINQRCLHLFLRHTAHFPTESNACPNLHPPAPGNNKSWGGGRRN